MSVANHAVALLAGVTLLILLLENPSIPLKLGQLTVTGITNVAKLAHPPTGG